MNTNQRAILKASRELDLAELADEIENPSQELQVMAIDLSTARSVQDPLAINFPFKSVFVRTASDTDAYVNLQLGTTSTFQDVIQITKNDGHINSIPKRGYLSWPAQTGKTMTIYFLAKSEFRSGSQISQSGGGVSINDGSAFSTARVDIATAAFAVVALNTSRKVASIQNNSSADVWLGSSSVSNTGTNLGFRLQAGATMQWRNTSALYGIALAASTGDYGLLILQET